MRWWPRRSREGSEARVASRAASSGAEQARDERLSAYLDDDLTGEERAALELEVTADQALRDELAGMRAVTSALGALEPVRAPRPFTLEAPPVASRRPRILDLGLQAGAAVAALLLVVAIVNPSGGAGFGDASPVELTTADSAAQTSGEGAGGAAFGAQAAPETAPRDGSGGGEEPASAPDPAPGEVATPATRATPGATESLQAPPPVAGASSGSDAGATPVSAPGFAADVQPGLVSPDDAETDGGIVSDATTTDSGDDAGGETTPPTSADTNPGVTPAGGDASSTGGEPATDTSGSGELAAPAQPEPGTEQVLEASDLGGDDRTDFVPALAVLTALLTALAALRWALTRPA